MRPNGGQAIESAAVTANAITIDTPQAMWKDAKKNDH
jgi:hypothetical protein